MRILANEPAAISSIGKELVTLHEFGKVSSWETWINGWTMSGAANAPIANMP